MNKLIIRLLLIILCFSVCIYPAHPQEWQKPFVGLSLNKTHPLTKGLVGCWVMNEQAGTHLQDHSGYENHGTLTGSTATWATTVKGGAVQVTGDGTTDRIDLGSITGNNPLSGYGSQAVSLAFKFYTGTVFSSSYPRIFDKSDGASSANGWGLNYRTSNVFELLVDGANPHDSGTVPDNTWVDVVITMKTGQLRVYFDGVLDSSDTDAITFSSNTTNAAIGNWNHTTDRECGEPIVYLYVWDRILTPAEVRMIYQDNYAMFGSVSAGRHVAFAAVAEGITNPIFKKQSPVFGGQVISLNEYRERNKKTASMSTVTINYEEGIKTCVNY